MLALPLFMLADSEQATMPWPDGKITVLDRTGRPSEMRQAAAKWNSSGLGLRVSFTEDEQKAGVTASKVAKPADFLRGCQRKDTLGCASLGRSSRLPWGKPSLQLIAGKKGVDDSMQLTAVAAHELGHLLGLAHNRRRCSLMNSDASCYRRQIHQRLANGCPLLYASVLDPGRWCPSRSSQRVLCGPTRADLNALLPRYGGSIRKDYSPWCKSTGRVRWLGWCLYPSWVPPGQKRPAFIVKTAAGDRCSRLAPAKYLDFLDYAVRQAEQSLAAASGSQSQKLSWISSRYRAMRVR